MITFDTREPAPLSVRWARLLLPLLTCAGYLAFRVYPAAHARIGLAEMILSSLLFAAMVFIACIAAADLIYPATTIARVPDPEALELTAEIRRVPDIDDTVAQACAAEIRRLDALLRGDCWRRHAGTLPIEVDEPELMTHEFTPLHHTPPRGIRLARPDLLPPESYIPRSSWDGVFRVPEVREQWTMGEIRWANRTRTGQLFGELS